jgi:hypothetical protein
MSHLRKWKRHKKQKTRESFLEPEKKFKKLDLKKLFIVLNAVNHFKTSSQYVISVLNYKNLGASIKIQENLKNKTYIQFGKSFREQKKKTSIAFLEHCFKILKKQRSKALVMDTKRVKQHILFQEYRSRYEILMGEFSDLSFRYTKPQEKFNCDDISGLLIFYSLGLILLIYWRLK